MPLSTRRAIGRLFVALACSFLAGCASSSGEGSAAPPPKAATSKPSAQTECTTLIDVLNAGVERVQKMSLTGASAGAAADELVAMAKALDELALETARLDIKSPDLARMSADYQSTTRKLAEAARDMAAAVKAHDERALEDAHQKLVRAKAAEHPLVESINHYCETGEVRPPRDPEPEVNPQT